MLTDEHVEHYRTFGFVVLRGQLDEETIAALSEEVDRALRDAFGARFDTRLDEGGIPGHHLPMMSTERTPVSLRLVEHLHPVARRLLAGRGAAGTRGGDPLLRPGTLAREARRLRELGVFEAAGRAREVT